MLLHRVQWSMCSFTINSYTRRELLYCADVVSVGIDMNLLTCVSFLRARHKG